METCTAGSESGLGKRTGGNIGTAPQADSTRQVLNLPVPRGFTRTEGISSGTHDFWWVWPRFCRWVQREVYRLWAGLLRWRVFEFVGK
jgi:hypothetical protein